MSGPQLIQLARAQRPPVPVVLLTSSAHPRELVRAYRMGISDCLLKPLARADLDEVINRLLVTAVEVLPTGGGLASQVLTRTPNDPAPAILARAG
jgi:DNA-binding NarL/FixJ family response regulator